MAWLDSVPGRHLCALNFGTKGHNIGHVKESSEKSPLGLRSIALFEAIKGVLALAAAGGLLSLRHTDLHAATDALLLRHGIDPETHYMRLFIEGVARATNHHVGQIAALALAYAVIRLAEGYGLWHAKHWAEWFAVISAGLYLPFELGHLVRRPTWLTSAVVVFNILLIIYLAKLLIDQRAARHRARLAAAQSGDPLITATPTAPVRKP